MIGGLLSRRHFSTGYFLTPAYGLNTDRRSYFNYKIFSTFEVEFANCLSKVLMMIQDQLRKLRIAIQFLTLFPTHLTKPPQPKELGQAAVWFPLVGLLIGGLVCGMGWVLQFILSPLVVAVTMTALWAALTGGLHLDGLADCFDALFLAATPQRRLEILRDPHLGTFGAVGLILHLLLKTSFLVSLMPLPSVALLLSPMLARWLLLLAARQRQARLQGLGADFALGLSQNTIWIASLLPLAFIAISGLRAILAAGLAFLVLVGVIWLARARLGGVTGDVLGMSVELTELAVLLGFVVHF
jgi:adenosylcobinamide-GDP ribazoletransferase